MRRFMAGIAIACAVTVGASGVAVAAKPTSKATKACTAALESSDQLQALAATYVSINSTLAQGLGVAAQSSTYIGALNAMTAAENKASTSIETLTAMIAPVLADYAANAKKCRAGK